MMDNRIIYDLLTMLGLEEREGKIYDSDLESFLIFNGGFLILNETSIIHRRDIKFDPVHNVKLTEYLLNVFFKKEEQDNGLYIYSFGLTDYINPVTLLKTFQGVVTSNQSEIRSDFFYNCNLAYIHCMYLISGFPSEDIHMYDYTEKDMYERMQKKK